MRYEDLIEDEYYVWCDSESVWSENTGRVAQYKKNTTTLVGAAVDEYLTLVFEQEHKGRNGWESVSKVCKYFRPLRDGELLLVSMLGRLPVELMQHD